MGFARFSIVHGSSLLSVYSNPLLLLLLSSPTVRLSALPSPRDVWKLRQQTARCRHRTFTTVPVNPCVCVCVYPVILWTYWKRENNDVVAEIVSRVKSTTLCKGAYKLRIPYVLTSKRLVCERNSHRVDVKISTYFNCLNSVRNKRAARMAVRNLVTYR